MYKILYNRKTTEKFETCVILERCSNHISKLRCNVPTEILIAFYNGSNYDSCFMMKELAIEYNVSLNASKKLQKSTAIQTRLMKNSKRCLRISLSSVITILINLVCWWENVFIVTNIRNIGRNLMKHHYLEQRFLQLKTQITIMHREFLKILKKTQVNIMICISKVIHCYRLILLKL